MIIIHIAFSYAAKLSYITRWTLIWYLFWCYSTNNWSFCIASKGRLKYTGKLTIAIRNVTPAQKLSLAKIAHIQLKMIYQEQNKYLFFAPSLSLLITFPRIIKLLFMYFPSFRRTPPAPVLAIRSEPAKSTKFCTHHLKFNDNTHRVRNK